MSTYLPMILSIALIWALAIASMLAGNPTAINAVIGIPMGALVGGSFLWMIKREMRQQP